LRYDIHKQAINGANPDDVTMRKNYRLRHVTTLFQDCGIKSFKKHLCSGTQNKNKEIYGLMSKHIEGVFLFVHHVKLLVRACYYIYFIIFIMVLIKYLFVKQLKQII